MRNSKGAAASALQVAIHYVQDQGVDGCEGVARRGRIGGIDFQEHGREITPNELVRETLRDRQDKLDVATT